MAFYSSPIDDMGVPMTPYNSPVDDSIADVAITMMELMDCGKYLKDGVLYTKIWEEKTNNSYSAKLINVDSKLTIIVNGWKSKGFGRGGGRWVFDLE